MKFSVSEFVTLIAKTDLSDEQIDQVVKVLRESERALVAGAPGARTLEFDIDRRKGIYGDDWRSPPPQSKEPPRTDSPTVRRIKAFINAAYANPQSVSKTPPSKPDKPKLH